MKNPTFVLKFGGTSVASPATIERIITLTTDTKRYPEGSIKAIVFSAFQGVTDQLITLANQAADKAQTKAGNVTTDIEERHIQAVHELLPPERRGRVLAEVSSLLQELQDILHGISLLGECSLRTLDHVTSFGERLSSCIITRAYEKAGFPVSLLDSTSLIETTGEFGASIPDTSRSYERIQSAFKALCHTAIVPGFIASNESGVITTLGRGGSDLTASIIGAALQVDAIEIWTDVDGILTADPRKVAQAFAVPQVSFEEAMELSHFGAKVLYPPTIQPAVALSIPIIIKNTFNPDSPGTTICKEKSRCAQQPITGISSIDSVALIRLQGSGMVGVSGIASRFFKALSLASINVILITQASSEHTICCAIAPHQTAKASRAVQEEFELEIEAGRIEPLHIEESLSVISIVGERMRKTPGVSAQIFQALGNHGINIVAIAQGSSERSISAVVSTRDESKALNAIHDEFFLSKTKSVHLWLAGTGLIGKTLLQQIDQQNDTLVHQYGIDIKLHGLLNSRTMRCTTDLSRPLSLTSPLSDNDAPADLAAFVTDCIEKNLPHSIFVDCSAHDAPTFHYQTLLNHSIAVVTPNKRAFSSTYEFYKDIIKTSSTRRTPLLYETSVGAALPVLSTLRDLIQSGDKIERIEAILSGTLSFIFNSMRINHLSFSEAVLEAKRLGFTEPDPRDDLSGLDVARKVLILARGVGIDLELQDVSLEPLIPSEATEGTADAFLKNLADLDSDFQRRLEVANENGESLFFSATVDCLTGKASIGLQSVQKNHPFCGLSGADNMIAFTTARYKERPLVVQGPGAGAEVTAAGVFADIIRAIR